MVGPVGHGVDDDAARKSQSREHELRIGEGRARRRWIGIGLRRIFPDVLENMKLAVAALRRRRRDRHSRVAVPGWKLFGAHRSSMSFVVGEPKCGRPSRQNQLRCRAPPRTGIRGKRAHSVVLIPRLSKEEALEGGGGRQSERREGRGRWRWGQVGSGADRNHFLVLRDASFARSGWSGRRVPRRHRRRASSAS